MKKVIVLAGVMIFFNFSFVSAESFEDFVKQQENGVAQEQQEFEEYQAEIEKEFEQYKNIVEEEYENYKKEILANWDKPEISDNKKWVEYSPDYQTKKIVDFENNNIKIDIIVGQNEKKEEKENKIKKALEDLMVEDKKTAFEKDKLSQNIEKKVIKEVKNIKKDEVKSDPILAPVFFNTPTPKKEEVSKEVKKIVAKAKIQEAPSKVEKTIVISIKIDLPSDSLLKRAKQYKASVSKYTDKNKLDLSLALAVIHTESAFNPMAKSPIPAYGLMQVVPGTAGKDVTKILYGKSYLLSPSYLYNDENNINIGTAYLGLLFYGYCKNIKDVESRLYCVIAAYNTGIGNLAQTFAGVKDIKKADAIINSMTSKVVYETLIKKLPKQETIDYLQRILKRKEAYKAI
ncbi:MAG: transglycosylase SLT domain-containing protein [bacterium]|nr:transglycosylase SLT domain-containing protein [bacterium]